MKGRVPRPRWEETTYLAVGVKLSNYPYAAGPGVSLGSGNLGDVVATPSLGA